MSNVEFIAWFYILPCVILIAISWIDQIYSRKPEAKIIAAFAYFPIVNIGAAVILSLIAFKCVMVAIVKLPTILKNVGKNKNSTN